MAETTSSDVKDISSAHQTLNDRQIQTLYDALEADDIGLAVKILGFIGDGRNLRAVGPLTVLLEYPDEAIQGNSAIALGKIGDKSAIGPLTEALKKSPDSVKVSIVTALGMFEDKSVIGAIESVPLTPDEPKLTNVVRSTVYRLQHPASPDGRGLQPGAAEVSADNDVDLTTLREERMAGTAMASTIERNPILAAIGSFFVPGLGQVYNGDGYVKGFMYLIGIYVGSIFFVIPGLAVWIYSIYDAYKKAGRITAGEIDATVPSTLGLIIYAFLAAIVIPIVLGGLILLISTALIYSMAG